MAMPGWVLLCALGSGTVHARDLDLSWSLTIEGEAAGTSEMRVRDVGSGVRVLETFTEVKVRPKPAKTWSRFLPWRWFQPAKEPAAVYQHRLTASREGAAPPAFHSVVGGEVPRAEVQGRQAGGMWRVSVSDGGSPREGSVRADSVDLTSLDLFDPASDWRSGGSRESLRVLDVRAGEVREGALVHVGNSELDVGGEATLVDSWEWRSNGDVTRMSYAPSGVIVRFEATYAGHAVRADLDGGLPRSSDDFGVPLSPAVEVIETSP